VLAVLCFSAQRAASSVQNCCKLSKTEGAPQSNYRPSLYYRYIIIHRDINSAYVQHGPTGESTAGLSQVILRATPAPQPTHRSARLSFRDVLTAMLNPGATHMTPVVRKWPSACWMSGGWRRYQLTDVQPVRGTQLEQLQRMHLCKNGSVLERDCRQFHLQKNRHALQTFCFCSKDQNSFDYVCHIPDVCTNMW
jgi:hypothetical protein